MVGKQTLSADVQHKIDNKTKPAGALGRLEALALQVAVAQQTTNPVMQHCALIIFIADHGITAEGISAFPQAVTAQMASNFLAGGAAATVFAKVNNVSVQLVDAGMLQPLAHENLLNCRIAAGTRNCRKQPAMTAAQYEQALAHGKQLGGSAVGEALCLGEMGIGNTSSASLLAHKLTQLPLQDLVGRGTGLDNAGLEHKLNVLQSAAARTTRRLTAPTALAEYGGFEIVMLAGAMLGAAQQGKIVLVDGFIASAAALAALAIDENIRSHLVFCHTSAEAGHAALLEALQARPLLDLQLRLGEGTGALLAWPLVKNAVAMLNDMASFATAGVSGPDGTDCDAAR